MTRFREIFESFAYTGQLICLRLKVLNETFSVSNVPMSLSWNWSICYYVHRQIYLHACVRSPKQREVGMETEEPNWFTGRNFKRELVYIRPWPPLKSYKIHLKWLNHANTGIPDRYPLNLGNRRVNHFTGKAKIWFIFFGEYAMRIWICLYTALISTCASILVS